MKRIRCQECDGNYILRDGKFGVFAGCSNYPRCRSTKKLYEVVLEYIRIYGTAGTGNAGSVKRRQPSIPIISITNWRSWTNFLIPGCRQ